METSLAQSLKLSLMSISGLGKDALHIHVALLVFLVALALFRSGNRYVLAWVTVLLVATLGEAIDLGVGRFSRLFSDASTSPNARRQIQPKP